MPVQMNLAEISQDSNFVSPPGRLKGFSTKYKPSNEGGRERTGSQLNDKAESIERVRR